MLAETTGAMLCKSAKISVISFLGLGCFRKLYFTRKALFPYIIIGEGIVEFNISPKEERKIASADLTAPKNGISMRCNVELRLRGSDM